jgi:outer membrane protein OmpA-like peptidoglycan-associated protein
MMKDSAVIKSGMEKEDSATVGFAPVKKDTVTRKVVAVKKETIADKPIAVQKENTPDKVTAVKKDSVANQVPAVRKDIGAIPKAEVKPEIKSIADNDTDGDGVPNDRDLCPNVSGSPGNAGCPIKDRDGDGVPDIVDNCPNEPGDKSRAGCPDPAVVSSYIRIPKDTVRLVIYFDVDKYSLTQNSFEVLSMAVDILKRNPGATCSLFGHSDIEGDTDYNMRLSENRVKVARNYMFSYGINPDRIITAAFGKSQFVIGQQDKSLTWMNRRVEVLIVKYQ